MREIQLQNEEKNIEEATIASIKKILESEAFQQVQNGERNDALISALQQNLLNLGYDLGKTGVLENGVDGDYGEITQNAVARFLNPRVQKNIELQSFINSSLENGLSYNEAEKIQDAIPQNLNQSIGQNLPELENLDKALELFKARSLFIGAKNKELNTTSLGDLVPRIEEFKLAVKKQHELISQ